MARPMGGKAAQLHGPRYTPDPSKRTPMGSRGSSNSRSAPQPAGDLAGGFGGRLPNEDLKRPGGRQCEASARPSYIRLERHSIRQAPVGDKRKGKETFADQSEAMAPSSASMKLENMYDRLRSVPDEMPAVEEEEDDDAEEGEIVTMREDASKVSRGYAENLLQMPAEASHASSSGIDRSVRAALKEELYAIVDQELAGHMATQAEGESNVDDDWVNVQVEEWRDLPSPGTNGDQSAPTKRSGIFGTIAAACGMRPTQHNKVRTVPNKTGLPSDGVSDCGSETDHIGDTIDNGSASTQQSGITSRTLARQPSPSGSAARVRTPNFEFAKPSIGTTTPAFRGTRTPRDASNTVPEREYYWPRARKRRSAQKRRPTGRPSNSPAPAKDHPAFTAASWRS